MPSVWKTVRVFISSTFRDMHAERDHLIKVVFPALRERLEKHRIYLDDIDLRWGVTREQAENDRVLDLCLQQIDECRPFFIGILGERYGWVPEQFPVQTLSQHGWVQHHSGKSVTDLEMIHGVLSKPQMSPRAFFYFRDPAALAGMPEEIRTGTFAETDSERIDRLADLKQRIRQGGSPVMDPFPARWDAQAYGRESRSPGRLVGLEAFGERVREQLWEAIKAEHTLSDIPPVETALDPLAEELDYHRRFMESRLRVHVPRKQINDALLAFAENDGTVACLVTGASGSGKSASLARFVMDYQRVHPEALVVPHFIGASPRSTSLREMLLRFCHVLKGHLRLAEDVPEEVTRLAITFREFIGKAPPDMRLLFVIDALNQLDETDRAQDLAWLPVQFPPHVKVVVSCIPGSENALDRRQHVLLEVEPLNDEERRTIIQQVPSLSAKTLDSSQIEQLLANPATTNPLFLLVALEELRGFGFHEQLNGRIAAFPQEGDTVTAIFTQVIERLEGEFDPGVVRTVLTLLASARRGLSERELQELTAGLPGADDLFPILRQLRPYLLRRAGLIGFYHGDLFKAVRQRWLDTFGQQRAAHGRLADYFQGQDYRLKPLAEQREETPWPANHRKVDELPWQLRQIALQSEPEDADPPLDRAWTEAKRIAPSWVVRRMAREHSPSLLMPRTTREWQTVGRLLCNWRFLEAKAEAGLIFDLLDDLAAAAKRCTSPLGVEKPLLKLIELGIRTDLRFLIRRPAALFQTLWNRFRAFEQSETERRRVLEEYRRAASHRELLVESADLLDPSHSELTRFLETWRKEKEAAQPGFRWIRSLLPPVESLTTSQVGVLVGHPTAVGAVAWSPDGARIFTAGGAADDHSIRIWDAATHLELLRFDGHEKAIRCLAVSPAGDTIASASHDRTVRLWDAHNGSLLAVLSGHEESVSCVAFWSDRSRLITGSEDRTVRVWDVRTRQELACLRRHTRPVTSVGVMNDARLLLSGDQEGGICRWCPRTGALLGELPSKQVCGKVSAFARDGRHALITKAHEICMLNIESGQPSASWSSSDLCAFAVFGPDVDQVAVATYSKILLASGQGGVPVRAGDHQNLGAVAFSPDGTQLVSGGFDAAGRIWDLAELGDRTLEAVIEAREMVEARGAAPPAPRRPGSFSTFAPDGRWFATIHNLMNSRPQISLWSFPDCHCLAALQGHALCEQNLAVSPDGRFLATVGIDRTLRIWDVGLRRQVHCLGEDETDDAGRHDTTLHLGPVGFAPDCCTVACGGSNGERCAVHLWDGPGDGGHRALAGPPGDRIFGITFSPDGRFLASLTSGGSVIVWTVADAAEWLRFELKGLADESSDNLLFARAAVRFSPDGRLIAAVRRGAPIEVWDVAEKRHALSLKQPSSSADSLAFSLDGQRLIAASGSEFGVSSIWELTTGCCVAMATGMSSAETLVAPSRVWRPFVRGGELVIEEAQTGSEVAWYPWPHIGCREIQVNPFDTRSFIASHSGMEALRLEGNEDGAGPANSPADGDTCPVRLLTARNDEIAAAPPRPLEETRPEVLPIENDRGVDLLRRGRYEDALEIFRGLVVRSNLRLREDAHAVVIGNYAAALLATQNIAGCERVLDELERRGQAQGTISRLRQAIARWRAGRTFWDRLKEWLLGRQKPFVLDFPLGELE